MQTLTDVQMAILDGSLLGDGSITKQKYGNSYFLKNQSRSHRAYLEWHHSEFGSLSRCLKDCDNYVNGKLYYRTTFSTRASPLFSSLRARWYPDGQKIVPNDLILSPLSVAVWFFDDGSNYFKGRSCKFATYCFSRQGCEYLCRQLKNLEINCYVDKQNVIHVRAESYKTLIDLVGPFMRWECFEHKIRYRDAEFTPITDDESKVILDLYKEGKTGREISKIVHRSEAAVSVVLRRTQSIAGLSLRNKSGVTGIAWDKERKKWKVSKRISGKLISLGRFDLLDDAKNAWLNLKGAN